MTTAATPNDATGGELGVQPRRWTREEYHRAGNLGLFGPSEHLELVKGEILQKVSPRNTPHITGIRKTSIALERAFGAGFDVRSQGPMALADGSEPEPDVLVVPGVPDDYGSEHPAASDARLVVEVSDTTLGYDRQTKAALYAEAGIADYWILNLPARQLEVRRNPVALPAGEQFAFGYQTTVYGEADTITPLAAPAAVIAVSDLLPMPRPG